MAEYEESVKDCIEAAVDRINELKEGNQRIILKEEQLLAVKDLLNGKDVLAILPTGFGKSMIFTVFNFARSELLNQAGKNDTTSVLVISPLKSLIEDQILELLSMSCTTGAKQRKHLRNRSDTTAVHLLYCRGGTRKEISRGPKRQQHQTASKPISSCSGRVPHCRNLDRKKVSLKLFTVHSLVECDKFIMILL